MGWIDFIPTLHFTRKMGLWGASLIWWKWSVCMAIIPRKHLTERLHHDAD